MPEAQVVQNETVKPISTKDQLKKLNEQKKLIAKKQKQLREEFNKGKDERIAAGKTKAATRKSVREAKSELRTLGVSVGDTLKSGDVDAIETLAGDIDKAATKLVDAINAFAKAEDKLNEL